MASALEVREVHKAFGDLRAVDGLSFDVQPGEIFALLGPNGAGKTTMVRMLLEIAHPDAGRIEWNLGQGAREDRGPQLGYLPEERGLHRDVPVLRTLVYFGMLRGLSRADARREGLAWLERLELADRAKAKLSALSKGNQQKVQFAAAVLHRPAFAVLDEPFTGFDPVNQDRFADHIRHMRDEGTTVLLSAHQMQLVERLADRILLIDHGREVLSGTLEEVRARAGIRRRLILQVEGDPDAGALAACPGVEHVEVSGPGRVVLDLAEVAQLNPTLEALARCATLLAVQDERPTLHDIYVDAVRRRAEVTA